MVQHLLVIIGAAPLLVLARPVHTLMLAGWIPTDGVRPAGVGAVRGTAAAPVLGPGLFVVVLFVTHLTSIYDEALDDRWLHEAEHVAYLLGAVRDVGGRARRRPQPAPWPASASVFGVVAGGALLGMVLLAATDPADADLRGAASAPSGALDDQRSAAALMWVTGMFTTLPLLVLAVWRWAATEERIARRAEALTDAAALTPSASAGTTHDRRSQLTQTLDRQRQGCLEQRDQAAGVPPLAAALDELGVELVDERGDGQAGADAVGLVEAEPEVLAHPLDGEAEVELAGGHRRRPGCPSASSARRPCR